MRPDRCARGGPRGGERGRGAAAGARQVIRGDGRQRLPASGTPTEPVVAVHCCTARQSPLRDDSEGALTCCALGRIRTCNLLIRSQMLYPLSYECSASRFFLPVGVAGTTLHDLRRDAKSISRDAANTGKSHRKQPSDPRPGRDRDGEAQTATGTATGGGRGEDGEPRQQVRRGREAPRGATAHPPRGGAPTPLRAAIGTSAALPLQGPGALKPRGPQGQAPPTRRTRWLPVLAGAPVNRDRPCSP